MSIVPLNRRGGASRAGLTALIASAIGLLPAGTASASIHSPVRAQRPQIVSARSTLKSLGPGGGSVKVMGTVKHTLSCQLKMLWVPAVKVMYSHNPTTSCHGGNYSARLVIGRNTTGKPRTVAIKLVARNGTSSASRALYVTVLPQSHSTPNVPGTTTTTLPTTVPPAPAMAGVGGGAPVSQGQSQDWAGYVAFGGPFKGAQGTFTVPAAHPSASEALAEWVGVDGASNTSLVQAGIDEEEGGSAGSVQIFAWWDVSAQAKQTPITSVKIAAGDSVTVVVWQASASALASPWWTTPMAATSLPNSPTAGRVPAPNGSSRRPPTPRPCRSLLLPPSARRRPFPTWARWERPPA